jgi:hypothetical protein
VLNYLSTMIQIHVGEWRYSSIFLPSALDGGEWSASRPYRINRGEKAPLTHRIGGWADPRAGLQALEKRKNLCCRESKLDRPARGPSLYRLIKVSLCLIIEHLIKA